MIVILNNIRSVYNVGSIFRTSDGAGVERIYLCGYTPTPENKLGKQRKDMSKVALGATDYVEWKEADSALEVIDELKESGKRIYALEQTPRSVFYDEIDCDEFDWDESVLVLGNEVDGLPEEIVKVVDQGIEIPMFGKKKSLNVSVALGVVAFHFSVNCRDR